jgi:hypothetical protein
VSRRSLLSVAALLLSACSTFSALTGSGEPTAQWVPGEVQAQDDRLLLDVTALALQKSGFPIGTGVDPNALTVHSGWHNSLAPFKGKGYRELCEVRYTKEAARKYKVEVRVRHEKNDDIHRPLDLSYAEWVPEADDVDRARIVLQQIHSLLDTDIEVGEKP